MSVTDASTVKSLHVMVTLSCFWTMVLVSSEPFTVMVMLVPSITTVLSYPNDLRVVYTWTYLADLRDYFEEIALMSPANRLRIQFPSPFLKHFPTPIVFQGMEDGAMFSKRVEASFDEGGPSVRLGFDRAIDIAGLIGAAITVDAGNVTGTRYQATGIATMDGPNAVVIGLVATVPSASGDTLLSATSGNGIVAIDDGGGWSGASELVLPFP